MVRLGGGVGPDLRIGAEVAAWRRDDGTVGQTLTSVSAAAYWYPRPRSRFYLKGGVGYVTHRASDGTDVITSTGFGPQFGIGQEYAFGRKWTFAPFINYALGSVGGGVKFNGGQAADRATVSFLQVGLGLTRP